MKVSDHYQNGINFSLILLIVVGMLASTLALFSPASQQSTNSLPLIVHTILHYIDTPQANKKPLTITDLVIDDSIISKPTPNPTAFSHNPNPIWLKIVVSNPYEHSESWVLDTTNNQLLEACIYERRLDKYSLNKRMLIKKIYNHANPRIQDMPYFTPAVATKITLKGHEKKIFYIQYQGLMSTHLHLNFESIETATYKNYYEKIILSAVIGILLTLIFVNLVFYFSLKKMQYLYYCLQELSVIVLFLIHSGYAMTFFNIDNADFSGLSLAMMPLVIIFTGSLFVDAFLDIRSFSYTFKNAPKIYAMLSLLLFILALIPVTQTLTLQFVIPPFVLSFIVMSIYLGLIAVSKGKTYAIAFCTAWTILILSVSFSLLSLIDIYQIESINHFYPVYFGYIVEGALLSLAMGMQVSTLRLKNEKGIKKLNQIFIERSHEAQELQQAFKEKTQALQEKNTKNKHLASASHDINHSLFLMKVNLEGLKNENNQQVISNTLSSLDYLQGITENILSVGQMDNKKSIGLIDTRLLFEQLYNELSPLAKQKNIRLRYRINHIIELDASKVILKRIMENLIRNAIQHTQSGGVLFSLRERNKYYQLQVFDTGCGMHQDTIKTLQHAFFQSSESNMGYGMGLYIISNLCQQSGYELKITTRLNQGSVFSVLINK